MNVTKTLCAVLGAVGLAVLLAAGPTREAQALPPVGGGGGGSGAACWTCKPILGGDGGSPSCCSGAMAGAQYCVGTYNQYGSCKSCSLWGKCSVPISIGDDTVYIP